MLLILKDTFSKINLSVEFTELLFLNNFNTFCMTVEIKKNYKAKCQAVCLCMQTLKR